MHTVNLSGGERGGRGRGEGREGKEGGRRRTRNELAKVCESHFDLPSLLGLDAVAMLIAGTLRDIGLLDEAE